MIVNDNLHDGEIKAHLEAELENLRINVNSSRTLRYDPQSYVFIVDEYHAFIDFSVLYICGQCECLLLSTFLYASGSSCPSR